MDIMLLTVMKPMCQVSPNFDTEYLLLQNLDVRINTLSNFCVFSITKTREMSINIWKLQ